MTVPQQQPSQAIPVLTSQNDTKVEDANQEVVQKVPAKGVSYFNPEQMPAPGLGLSSPNDDTLPKIFTRIKIRDMTMSNRIWVSSICQYSAPDGFCARLQLRTMTLVSIVSLLMKFFEP
ncbi:hypothetical protein LZL87_013619 [Fusarium oxysporum]|nr:hypothetical protein LZL87_013619 [Fusarium oxysporum]